MDAREKEYGVPITRIIARIQSRDLAATKEFYQDLIGLGVDMEEEPDFLMLSAETTPSAQMIVNDNGHAGLPPGFAIDVGTPDELAMIHDRALKRRLVIIEPIKDTPWGIRRFSMLDPDGTCITIVCHVRE